MSDVVATTQSLGAQIQAVEPSAPANSSDARFDSFFADSNGFEEPQRREDPAAQTAPQNAEPPEPQQDAPEAPEAKEAPEEPQAYQSLSDLLAAHKIDPESVKSLHVTTKIDGVEKQVPLAEVLESYQLKGHVNNKSVELSNQRTAFEQEREAVRTLARQQLQQNQALGNAAMQILNHDYQRIDWNSLRANDPGQYAAMQADFQQRQGAIQNYVAQIQQQAALEEQQRLQSIQQAMPQEHERLLDRIPEWKDPKVFDAARNEIKTYARNLGFQDAELNQIYDHRYMLILRDAARYQALQAANPEVLKKVRQAPPMAAPGSRQNVTPKDAQRKQVVERLNRNPRDPDAQAAAFEFFAT